MFHGSGLMRVKSRYNRIFNKEQNLVAGCNVCVGTVFVVWWQDAYLQDYHEGMTTRHIRCACTVSNTSLIYYFICVSFISLSAKAHLPLAKGMSTTVVVDHFES